MYTYLYQKVSFVFFFTFLMKFMTELLKGCHRSNELFRFSFNEALFRSLLRWATGLILLRKDTGANCIENKNFILSSL